MMVRVNDEVSEAFTKMGYKQCPAPVVTLRKRIYFNNNWTNGTTGFDVMGRFTLFYLYAAHPKRDLFVISPIA